MRRLRLFCLNRLSEGWLEERWLEGGWVNGDSNRGMIYLLEPILVAIVVITLFVLFSPHAGAEPENLRLMELHAQDVLALVQKDGSAKRLAGGDESGVKGDLELLQELNENYGHRFYRGEELVAWKGVPGGSRVSVSRSYADSEVYFRMRLEVWLE